MRVCIITTKYNFKTAGGSVGDIDLRARFLTERGHKVTVVSVFSKFNSELPEFTYRFKAEQVERAGLLGIQIGVYRLLKKYEAETDVFHVDGQVFLYGAGCYRFLGGEVPVLGFFNHWLNAWADETTGWTTPVGAYLRPFMAIKKKIRFMLERVFGVPLGNRMDAFIYNTPMLGETFMRHGFKHGLILPDFLDTRDISKREGINPEKIVAHQERPFPFTILCAGRMLPEKGFDLVVSAFAKLTEKQNYRVIMSGTGPELEHLKELARSLNVSDYFSFPGWVEREELLGFFRKAHLFVFPKWWADYGAIVLEEAMAFGLPSIIPKDGSLGWLSGDTAITYVNDDVSELKKSIERLSVNADERIARAKKGLARSALLDYRILGNELEKMLQSVVTTQQQ